MTALRILNIVLNSFAFFLIFTVATFKPNSDEKVTSLLIHHHLLNFIHRPMGVAKSLKCEHVVTWDAANLPSGIYFYHLTAGNQSVNGKMVVVK
jgi:hypothetical protein